MKKLLLIPLLAFLIGCASFSTNVFRAEQTAVNLAYTSYVGYTNALPTLKLTPEQVATVKDARLRFASSVTLLDNWRAAYETNSATETYVQAALDAVYANSSNLVWVINYVRNGANP